MAPGSVASPQEGSVVTVVGILWVVVTPYCTGLVVASSPLANRLVRRHLRACTALGWSALAALVGGVFLVGGHTGMAMAVMSAPFAGLAIWTSGPGRDDDDPEPKPDDPPPAPDAVPRRGIRLPAPPRKRPTGHPALRRPRLPAR
jgi:hypothetical protein